MTTWAERTRPTGQSPFFPLDVGPGRVGLDESDVELRFKDLGSGRVGIEADGLYIAVDGGNGRFTLDLLSSVIPWTERLPGSTSWTERSA